MVAHPLFFLFMYKSFIKINRKCRFISTYKGLFVSPLGMNMPLKKLTETITSIYDEEYFKYIMPEQKGRECLAVFALFPKVLYESFLIR